MQMKAWRSEAYDRGTKKLLWVGQVTETDNFEAVSGAVVDRLKREARRGFWVFFFFLTSHSVHSIIIKTRNIPAPPPTLSLVSL